MKLFLLSMSAIGTVGSIFCIVSKLSDINYFQDWIMLSMLVTLLSMSVIGIALNYKFLQVKRIPFNRAIAGSRPKISLPLPADIFSSAITPAIN
jgi:hypothetical protein